MRIRYMVFIPKTKQNRTLSAAPFSFSAQPSLLRRNRRRIISCPGSDQPPWPLHIAGSLFLHRQTTRPPHVSPTTQKPPPVSQQQAANASRLRIQQSTTRHAATVNHSRILTKTKVNGLSAPWNPRVSRQNDTLIRTMISSYTIHTRDGWKHPITFILYMMTVYATYYIYQWTILLRATISIVFSGDF